MALKITQELRENRQLALTVEVDKERVDRELRKAANKLSGQYRLPGFRKGKAPYHIVLQQIGLPSLFSEFVDELGQEVYKAALEQEKIEPYAIAAMEDVKLEPLTYVLVIPLEPQIELGDYRALRLAEETTATSDEDVEKQIEQYREQHSSWRAADRPSDYGDTLNIDVKSVIVASSDEATSGETAGDETADDETAKSEETVVLNENDWDVTPDKENPMEPPGFDEALLGLTVGDAKEFDLSWPAEHQGLYAGKTAHFTVKVNEIKAYQKPEVNDDFAKLIGPDFETVDALKENIRNSLAERSKTSAENAYAEKVLDAAVELSTLNYPPVVIEDQLDSMVAQFENMLRRFGIDDLEGYFRRVGQKPEEYREGLRPEATKQAKRNLVLSEILRAEGLQVEEAEFEARVQEMISSDKMDEQQAESFSEVVRGNGRAYLESQILQEKAIRRLLAIARGEEVPSPAPAIAASDQATTDEATSDAPAATSDEIPAAAENKATS